MNKSISEDISLQISNKNKDFFILRWNDSNEFDCAESFESLIGYTKSKIAQMPNKHHSLMNEEDALKLKEVIVKSQSDDIPELSQDIELNSASGKCFWFREYITIEQNEYSSVLFNITDFKAKEIDLVKKMEETEALNHSKDKLISIISHDLRAPFSSLLGFSEILLNETSLPEEERTEYLKYIYDASKIQLQMVNHLLDWTRLQTGTMKFAPQRIDIKDIVDSCVSVLTGSIIRKEIEIKVIGENGNFVTADERLMGQVITNLLSNAVKFTPSGKSITVKIDMYKNDMIEIIVSDEGVGIEEKHHDKLFRIDSKYSKTGTEGEKGSGFGLALVKEIVEKHSGKIWFYSEINKGSEFHFTLPKSEDTILILEEHKELQSVYKRVIDESFSNYKMKFCNNGFEALNVFLTKMPAVLITYHSMPLMNGTQLVSSLREKDIHNKVDVIVLGDDITEIEKKEYSKLGVELFLELNANNKAIENVLSKLS